MPDDRITNPCSIVFFGASGDLFKRMLLPAVYSMHLNGTLPTDFALIGFSRIAVRPTMLSAQYCHEQLDEFMPDGQKPQGSMWDDFARTHRLHHRRFQRHATLRRAQRAAWRRTTRSSVPAGNHLFYLATPPPVFPEIIKQLKTAGLDKERRLAGRASSSRSRSGRISHSARALQKAIESVFPENEIYRIDHYLGKEPVQDIIALRFANTIFEPIWNRNYVPNVQITSAESLGVEAARRLLR